MKGISPSMMKHSRSSSDLRDLRPSRKFMTIINRIRHNDYTQQNSDSHSDRIARENIIYQADQLSHRVRFNASTFEDIPEEGNCSSRNLLLREQYEKIVKNVSLVRKPSISLDIPRSRGSSPTKSSFILKQKKITSPLLVSAQEKIKRIAMMKKP